ncbi:I78 family peptidase inhibitor [Kushneria phosphatilytica]|nr:I78 family peptidase inhibitor [Kushneria phosphatilytica]
MLGHLARIIGGSRPGRLCALSAVTFVAGCSWFGGGSDSSTQQNEAAPSKTTALPHHADKSTCGADRLQDLIGRTLEPGVRRQIVNRSGAEQYRVLGPDTMVTMDFNAQRLDIRVDENQQISEFDCG